MIRIPGFLSTALSITVTLAPGAAQEAEPRPRPQPLPAGAEAPLEAAFVARTEALGSEVLAADYLRRHPQGSELDRAVDGLLRRYGSIWRSGGLGEVGVRLGMLRDVRRAMHLGAADPLVLLVAADVCLWLQRHEAAQTWIAQAVQGLEQAGASPLARYIAAERHRAIASYRESREGDAALAQSSADLLVAAAADPSFAGAGARLYLELVRTFVGGTIEHRHQALVERIAAAPGVPEWARLVLEAEWHKAAAWRARGGGYADTVTDTGWQGFEHHLREAAERLVAAHALLPQLPDAAGTMVGIVGASGGSYEDMRVWLDRSVAASFDHLAPYQSLLWYTMPRWGGSHARMLRFGRECVATGRFDTFVPDVFRTALITMSRDFEDRRVLYARMSVVETLRKVHEGYRSAWPTQWERLNELSQQVVELVLMKQEAQAAQLYQSLDGEFADRVLERYGLGKEWVLAAMQPHFLPHVCREVGVFDVFAGWQGARYDDGHDYEPRPLPDAEVPMATPAGRGVLPWTEEVLLGAHDAAATIAGDAAWREPARRAVAAYAGHVYGLLDPAARQALVEDVNAALDQGCEEAVLLYVAARVLEPTAERLAGELLDRAVAALERRPYPHVVHFWILRRLEARDRQARHTEQADALLERLDEHAAAAAAGPEFAGERSRFYCEAILPPGTLGWGLGPLRPASVERIAADERVDPWLRDVLQGMHHTAVAVGLDYALESATDRASFFEHVAEAARHLRAAHERHPDRPEAAAVMIVVCSLDGTVGPARQWLDRALAIEPDHEPAHSNFLWTRRPEFGGSRAALYRFGVECLETRRFSSFVPGQWVRAVEYASSSLASWRHAWSPADVQRRYAQLCADALGAAPDFAVTRNLAAGRTVVAWAGGNYADAALQWLADGKDISGAWLRRLRIERTAIVADLESAAVR